MTMYLNNENISGRVCATNLLSMHVSNRVQVLLLRGDKDFFFFQLKTLTAIKPIVRFSVERNQPELIDDKRKEGVNDKLRPEEEREIVP